MAKKPDSYTVMVVPAESARVKRFRVSRTTIRLVLTLNLLVLGVAGAAGLHYYLVVDEAAQVLTLRRENVQLRSELRLVQEKISHVSEALERVERLDTKLRVLTQVRDAERNLAIGPLAGTGEVLDGLTRPGGVGGESDAVPELDGVASDEDIELLQSRLDNLAAEAVREEASLRHLNEYFQDQKTVLAATPSIWPAKGWVTSTFGARTDPFTGERSVHHGMDIAAEAGTKVRAPASGTVTYAGVLGAYGKVVVIDHGYGVVSRYGHLSELFAQVGDTLDRGEVFAAIGNTGRSTGPHLHYEVRVNGIAEDPRKFILD